MSENDANKEISFEAACFSTNYTNFSSISILKQYFMSTKCSDIEYNNDFTVTFKHTLSIENNNSIECKTTYTEICPLSKNVKFEDMDCVVVFFDLENTDSLSELNKILKNISELLSAEKKVYVVSFYTNEKNIKNNYTEDDVQSFIGRYMIDNYDIFKVNMDSYELAEKIDKIAIETLQEKNIINGNKDFDTDKSKSMCSIL